MNTKEAIKKEIDSLPEELLNTVHQLIVDLKSKSQKPRKGWTTRDFKGSLDNLDIRKKSYE